MPNNVSLKLMTTLIRTAEGKYQTVLSSVFEGKSYTEGAIIEYVPNAIGYPSPGAVVVPATCTWDVFQAIDNAQSGAVVEGEEPGAWEIVEGSVCDADTGEPIDPTVL